MKISTLIKSNKHQIEHIFESLFDELNLIYQAQNRLLKGRPDSLIGDIIIDFKYQITERQLSQWVQTTGRQYIQEYYQINGKKPSLLIVISESFIAYYDESIILRDKREVTIKNVESLIECLLEPKIINSEQFAILFGINSPLYILSYARLEKHFDDHSGEKTPRFSEWRKHFRLAYHDEEVGKDVISTEKPNLITIYDLIEEGLSQIEQLGLKYLNSAVNQEILKEYEFTN